MRPFKGKREDEVGKKWEITLKRLSNTCATRTRVEFVIFRGGVKREVESG